MECIVKIQRWYIKQRQKRFYKSKLKNDRNLGKEKLCILLYDMEKSIKKQEEDCSKRMIALAKAQGTTRDKEKEQE